MVIGYDRCIKIYRLAGNPTAQVHTGHGKEIGESPYERSDIIRSESVQRNPCLCLLVGGDDVARGRLDTVPYIYSDPTRLTDRSGDEDWIDRDGSDGQRPTLCRTLSQRPLPIHILLGEEGDFLGSERPLGGRDFDPCPVRSVVVRPVVDPGILPTGLRRQRPLGQRREHLAVLDPSILLAPRPELVVLRGMTEEIMDRPEFVIHRQPIGVRLIEERMRLPAREEPQVAVVAHIPHHLP